MAAATGFVAYCPACNTGLAAVYAYCPVCGGWLGVMAPLADARGVQVRQGIARPTTARRRAKLRLVVARDGTNCWLCGRPVDMTLRDGQKMAASLDHVVRRADGGSNGVANLKLAHRLCNTKRDIRHVREAKRAALADGGA